MKEKRECQVVQDLLPNYIEKLTNEETNKFIEEHLIECKECKSVLEKMEKKLETDVKPKEDKEINYIKKYSVRLKVFKILAIMFVLVVLIFILSIERRMVILTSLMNKVKEIDYSNSYVSIKTFNEPDDSCGIINSYLKDNIELWEIESFNRGRNQYTKSINYYKNDGEQFCIEQYCNLEKQLFSDKYVIPYSYGHGQNMLALMGVGLLIQTPEDYFDYVFNSSIESVRYDNKDCYLIRKNLNELVVEKSTGLVIRISSKVAERSTVVYYNYSFGTVTDEDIQKPDISEYKKEGTGW